MKCALSMLEEIRGAPAWHPTRPWEAWKSERDALLRRFVNEQLYAYSPYYRRLFDAHAIDPKKIRGVADLRRLPFTTKLDVAPTADNPTRHIDLVLRPDAEKIRRFAPKVQLASLLLTRALHGTAAATERVRQEYGPAHLIFTTGRTALPTQFIYSAVDMERLFLVGRRLVDVVGFAPEGRCLNVFPYAPHLAFWQVFACSQAGGILMLHTGGGKVMGTAGNLLALTRMQPTGVLGVPGYVYHLLREALAQGVRLANLELIALGGERVPIPLRVRLREMCAQMGRPDVRIHSVLGFTEARQCWAECPPPDPETSYGFHSYPDLEIFEGVHPETGEPVGPGERCELVYTGLAGHGSCVLRYRTGDIAEGGIVYDPCPGCGRVVPRISTNLSRKTDIGEFQLTKIRGTLVDLNTFLPCMSDVREVVEWQLVVRKQDGDEHGLDEIVLAISVDDGCDVDALKARLTKKLLAETEVAPNVIEVVPLPVLEERLGLDTQMKELRIRDQRGVANK